MALPEQPLIHPILPEQTLILVAPPANSTPSISTMTSAMVNFLERPLGDRTKM